MPFSEDSFTADLKQTEINGRKYSCYEFNVLGAGPFELQCKRLFLDNLETAGDVDLRQVVGSKKLDNAAGLFQSLSNLLNKTDFEEFYAFHIKCIESCIDITDTKNIKPVSANDLKRPYNYALFFWFLRCQLGPFTDLLPENWKEVLTGMMKALQAKELKSSEELAQT